jgi:UrcA family protein
MKTLTALITTAGLALSLSTRALADAHIEWLSQKVEFADLDVTRAPGAAALYQRIKHAASNVCRNWDPMGLVEIRQLNIDCMQAAIARAVADVNRPALTAYAASLGVAQNRINLASTQ